MGKKMTEGDMDVDQPNGDQENVKPERSKYEDKAKFVSAIAQPLASKKLNKKILKLLKLAKDVENNKSTLILGLKDSQRWIRKNELKKGETVLVVFAGDVTPIDVMCHMPAVCEEKNIPYVYIVSKQDLAHAVGFQNSCLMALIREHENYKNVYEECYQEVKKLGHIM